MRDAHQGVEVGLSRGMHTQVMQSDTHTETDKHLQAVLPGRQEGRVGVVHHQLGLLLRQIGEAVGGQYV